MMEEDYSRSNTDVEVVDYEHLEENELDCDLDRANFYSVGDANRREEFREVSKRISSDEELNPMLYKHLSDDASSNASCSSHGRFSSVSSCDVIDDDVIDEDICDLMDSCVSKIG